MTAPSPRGPWSATVTRTDTAERTPIVALLAKVGGETVAQILADDRRFVADPSEIRALRIVFEQVEHALYQARRVEDEQRRMQEQHARRQRSQRGRSDRR